MLFTVLVGASILTLIVALWGVIKVTSIGGGCLTLLVIIFLIFFLILFLAVFSI